MKKIILGVGIFLAFVVLGIFASFIINKTNSSKKIEVVGAVGGGKENLLSDTDFNKILLDKYNLLPVNDSWSNGKLIKDKLAYQSGNELKKYDFVFFSDERFYEYYKLPASGGEVPREKILSSSITLNTPIVIYSWDVICDALIEEKIVTQRDGVYYITDMEKLIQYIIDGKKWSDIGVNDTFGKINIASTDPVTSSPGATYYGLLASIMNEGYVDESNIESVIPKLEEFYKLSGFMNNTPADLFDQYLRMGRGAYPLVVDYEKSIIDFAHQNPTGYDQVKSNIRILYPEPTIWNSHCLISFTENGTAYIKSFEDKEIQNIAWQKYGFRTGLTGGLYDVNSISVPGIPKEIMSVTRGLKKNIYDLIINDLKEN